MSMLVSIPSYRIERDEDDYRNRDFDILFTKAMCWYPEVEIPEDMVSNSSKREKREPVHAGIVALRSLNTGNDISQRQLDAAFDYLERAIAFYENNPWEGLEPYPGRNEQAAGSLRELRGALL